MSDQTDVNCLPKPRDRSGPPRRSGARRIAVTLVLLASASGGLLLAGCGSGHSGTTVVDPVSNTRSVTIAVNWPQTASRKISGRAIPISTNSVVLKVVDSGGFVETQTLNKPASGGTTATANFVGLRPGTLQITGTAFSSADGSGDSLDTASITATLSSGSTGTIQLAFGDVPFSSMQLVVPSSTVAKGQTETLSIIGFDANGHEIATSSSGEWSTSNANVASIDASGVVTGVAPGQSTVAFTDATTKLTASTTITVPGFTSLTIASPNGTQAVQTSSTITLTATGVDATGATVTSPPGSWSSSNTAVATIDSSGVVTGVTPGTTTITFTDSTYGQKATFALTVTSTPFSSIALTASGSTTLLQTQTVQLTATALDANGKTLQVSPPGTWVSGSPGIATVNASGLVTALQPGTTTITFTDSTFKLTASLTIVVHGGNSTVTIQ